jgi:hypothetical protein
MISWLETHAGLAGWGQAIGSLITLWVAFAVPSFQRSASQREAEAALAPILEATLHALHFTFTFSSLEEPDEAARGRADLRAAIRSLNEFPATSLRLPLIRPFNQFRAACDFLYLRFEEEPDELDLAQVIQDSIIEMYMRSALGYAQDIKRHATKIDLGDAIEEFELSLMPATEERSETER